MNEYFKIKTHSLTSGVAVSKLFNVAESQFTSMPQELLSVVLLTFKLYFQDDTSGEVIHKKAFWILKNSAHM